MNTLAKWVDHFVSVQKSLDVFRRNAKNDQALLWIHMTQRYNGDDFEVLGTILGKDQKNQHAKPFNLSGQIPKIQKRIETESDSLSHVIWRLISDCFSSDLSKVHCLLELGNINQIIKYDMI